MSNGIDTTVGVGFMLDAVGVGGELIAVGIVTLLRDARIDVPNKVRMAVGRPRRGRGGVAKTLAVGGAGSGNLSMGKIVWGMTRDDNMGTGR